MKRPASIPYLLAISVWIATAVAASGTSVWTNAAQAANEFAPFPLMGEFIARDGTTALQATPLAAGDFIVAIYRNGLPGDRGDDSPISSEKMSTASLQDRLAAYDRIERTSPTLGKPAPDETILTFPDDFTQVKAGIMSAGGQTTKEVGSFHMHVEFMQPLKPGRVPSHQDRGNSGIYIFNNYEIQILDTFAIDLDESNNALELKSKSTRWCGALYKQKAPDLNMAYPPLQWQTYDIDFQAPKFDDDQKVKNARITVRHNGVLIHDDVELKTGTGNGAKRPQLAEGPIYFQNHGNPVLFRNVWATELKRDE